MSRPAVAAAVLSASVALALAGGADPCECLNWRSVYSSDRVACGEGLEFHVFEGAFGYDLPGIEYIKKEFRAVYDQFCTSFFMKLDSTLCVNLGMYALGTPGLLAGQWCYVSKECAELNGGQTIPDKAAPKAGSGWFNSPPPSPLPRDVSWKTCDRNGDKLLRDVPPAELLELARSMGAAAGYVTKIAYPRLLPPNHTWVTIGDAVAKGDLEGMPKALRVAIERRVPVVIDVDSDGHGHQKIIHGREVYHLTNTTGWPYSRGKDVGEL
mmetsp:Transcript_2864/g.6564  ORF Transcript_2864/g.6564 Transcript_2864/m.6564 type:complete len:268 (+) Transcript_2864:67-870(+)